MAETPTLRCMKCGFETPDGKAAYEHRCPPAPAAPSVGEPKSQIADLSAAVMAYQSEVRALRSSLEEARKDSALLADAVYVARGALTNDEIPEAFARIDSVLDIADRIVHQPRSWDRSQPVEL